MSSARSLFACHQPLDPDFEGRVDQHDGRVDVARSCRGRDTPGRVEDDIHSHAHGIVDVCGNAIVQAVRLPMQGKGAAPQLGFKGGRSNRVVILGRGRVAGHDASWKDKPAIARKTAAHLAENSVLACAARPHDQHHPPGADRPGSWQEARR